MSQIQVLATVVLVHNEPNRALVRLQRTTETPDAAGLARQIHSQIGIETSHRVGFFFAPQQDMLSTIRPDQTPSA